MSFLKDAFSSLLSKKSEIIANKEDTGPSATPVGTEEKKNIAKKEEPKTGGKKENERTGLTLRPGGNYGSF